MSRKSNESFDNFSSAESQTLLPGHSSGFQPSAKATDSQQCTCGKSTFTKWALIFCGVSTLTNLALGFIPVKPMACHDELASISRAQVNQLHRPSPYIGLDRIDRNNSVPPQSLVNFPHVIAQVDKSRPDKVFDDDTLRYMSRTGTVSPQMHEIRLEDTISTVVQFRAIDYGMENCEFSILLPPDKLILQGQDIHKSNLVSQTFEIHRLDSTWYLDTKELSYQTRPRRLSRLDTITFGGEGLRWSYNYSCAWDELMTFELACRDKTTGAQHIPCDISWWQGEEDETPSPGIIIRQHSSI